MNTVYSLVYYECDYNNSEFKVIINKETPLLSEEDAIDCLLRLIQPKIKLHFDRLLNLGNDSDAVSDSEFENVLAYSKSCGIKGKKRLLDLYFNNIKDDQLHTGYSIRCLGMDKKPN
jgi:hypothetical protein